MLFRSNSDRLIFLQTKFNVFDDSELKSKIKKFEVDGASVDKIQSDGGDCLALISNIVNGDKVKKEISISKYIFDLMVDSDPSQNKMYTQWMLNTFYRLLKTGDIVNAIRFSVEDLPLAKEYFLIFEGNKRKQKFKTLCC